MAIYPHIFNHTSPLIYLSIDILIKRVAPPLRGCIAKAALSSLSSPSSKTREQMEARRVARKEPHV